MPNDEYRFGPVDYQWETPVEVDVQQFFERINTDKTTGFFTRSELYAFVSRALETHQNLQFFIKAASVITFEALDHDHSGNLSLDEFVSGIQAYAKAHKLNAPFVIDLESIYHEQAHENSLTLDNFKTIVHNHLDVKQIHETETRTGTEPSKLRGILTPMLADNLYQALGGATFDEKAFSSAVLTISKEKGLFSPSATDIQKVFSKIDVNKNGSITKAELKEALVNSLQSGNASNLIIELAVAVTFANMDKNKSGDVSLEEYRAAIISYANHFGITLPSQEFIDRSWRRSHEPGEHFTSESLSKVIEQNYGLEASGKISDD